MANGNTKSLFMEFPQSCISLESIFFIRNRRD
jgi:hypothetical protein